MQVLIAGHGQNLQSGTVQAALQEVAPLVSDADLLIASLSLSFCTVLLQQQRQQSSLITDKVLPAAMSLTKSPLLQVTHSDDNKNKSNTYIIKYMKYKYIIMASQ